MSKRIAICCDGTWNTPDRKDRGKFRPSNVVKMARAIAPRDGKGTDQVVFYDQGVGTGFGLDRLTGGAFGQGVAKNVVDAYRFLVHNFVEGDEVFLFGFSRGAYTARSAGGFIRNCGILRKPFAEKIRNAYALYRSKEHAPDSAAAREFRHRFGVETRIRFIGVWDTVGALGVPVGFLRWLTRHKHEFHDVTLSRTVDSAFHAVAIDERRGPFRPTLWETQASDRQRVEQVWFAGVHTNVGGGYEDTGLSDITFAWMRDRAAECGLAFDEGVLEDLDPNPRGELRNSMKGIYRLTRGHLREIGAPSGTESVHPSAIERHEKHGPPAYAPRNLVDWLEEHGRKREDPPPASPVGAATEPGAGEGASDAPPPARE